MQACPGILSRRLLHTSYQPRAVIMAPSFQLASARYSSNARKRVFDKSIPHDIVHVVDSETGRLGPPRALADILSTIDKELSRIELIAEHPQPVIRIITREFARQQRKDDKMRALHAKQTQAERKQLQMTWGVDGNDLARKIARARGYLTKNHPVDFVLSKKRGVPLPSRDAMVWRMDGIVAALRDVSTVSNRSIGSQLATIQLRPSKPNDIGAPKE